MTAKRDIDNFIREMNRLIDKAVSASEMRDVGEEAIRLIRSRTRRGYGVAERYGSESKLKRLSPRYVKFRRDHSEDLAPETSPTKSNLTFSGQMLDSFKVIDARLGSVSVSPWGARWGSSESNQKVAEYVSTARPFNDLSLKEYKALVRFYRLQFGDLVKRKHL